MFSSAVNSGSNWWNWKIKPIYWFLNAASFFFDNSNGFIPPISTLPEVGISSVPKICKSVVFPAPDEPTIDTTSPFWTSKLTSFKTCKSLYVCEIDVAF